MAKIQPEVHAMHSSRDLNRKLRSSNVSAEEPDAVFGLEILENRRLLSATVINPGGPILGVSSTADTILHEHKNKKFPPHLGPFITIAPATNLKASIDWGDGTTSTGTLKADGIVGLDEIKFE